MTDPIAALGTWPVVGGVTGGSIDQGAKPAMSAQNRSWGFASGRRRRRPHLEQLEDRELPTFTLVHQAAMAAPGTLVALASHAATVARASGNAATPKPGDTTGTLTPHELARQTFIGRYKGNYVIGPGRTSDQAAQLSAKGYGGGNQARFWWTNMRITVPTDPTQPVTGVIYIISRNVGTTGTQLFLDLVGDRATSVRGFPTHYTFSVDPASSGIYANAGGYGTGAGTMNIRFFRPGPGSFPHSLMGKMDFAINGLIDTSGNFNLIGVLGNTPQQP
jgi:hypothetical protein